MEASHFTRAEREREVLTKLVREVIKCQHDLKPLPLKLVDKLKAAIKEVESE